MTIKADDKGELLPFSFITQAEPWEDHDCSVRFYRAMPYYRCHGGCNYFVRIEVLGEGF